MCSERDSPLEPFVLLAPGQPELARLTCGAHLGPPVLTRKQKRPRVNSLVCDRAAAFCAAGPPEALSWMSRLVTQAAKRERELARAHSQRLKQATLSLPGESVSRGFADRGALEGYPSHYTSLVKFESKHNFHSRKWTWQCHIQNGVNFCVNGRWFDTGIQYIFSMDLDPGIHHHIHPNVHMLIIYGHILYYKAPKLRCWHVAWNLL